MKIVEYYTPFMEVPVDLWMDEGLTAVQKAIMAYIWSMTANKDDNKAIIRSKELEEITGLDRTNVYRNTKDLEKMGYISKALVKTEQSTSKVAEYTLNLPYLTSKYDL